MILIVENSPVDAKLAEIALDSAGYKDYMTVESAEEALEICEESPPSMIIADVGLPGMDGIELCKTLSNRASPCCDIPFLFVSGESRKCYTALRALAAGAQNFIPKPFTRQKLVKAVTLCMTLVSAQRARVDYNQHVQRTFTRL